jgi:aquaporin Z
LFVGGWALEQLWLFIVAPLIGAAIASGLYGMVRSEPLIQARVAEAALPSEQKERAQ